MVATAEALDQLEAFRRATVDLREEFIREFALLWPGAAALSAPGVARQQWLELVVALIQRWRPVFAQVAMETYRTQAVLEVGAVPAFLAAGGAGVVVPDLDVAELVAAMVVLVFTPLGRDAERAAAFRRASQQREAQRRAEVGLPPPEPELDIPREDRVTPREARIFDRAAEAAARLAVNGGRDAVQRAVQQDRLAVGWMRITDSDPCAFCLMLASRGPVYKSAATAGFEIDPVRGEINRFHDNCACQVVPVFTRNERFLPESTRRAKRVWEAAQREAIAAGQLKRGTSNDALNALRRYMAAQQRGEIDGEVDSGAAAEAA